MPASESNIPDMKRKNREICDKVQSGRLGELKEGESCNPTFLPTGIDLKVEYIREATSLDDYYLSKEKGIDEYSTITPKKYVKINDIDAIVYEVSWSLASNRAYLFSLGNSYFLEITESMLGEELFTQIIDSLEFSK